MFYFRRLFLSFLIFLLAGNSTLATFNDIKNNELRPEVIEFLRELGIGDSTENFYPRRPISLVEFLAMGLTSAGVKDLPKNVASKFVDIDNEDWFHPFVVKAEKLGLLEDFRGKKLLPKRSLTRGETVKLGLEIFGIGVPLTPPDEEFGFQDVRKSHLLARFIFRAVKMGAIDPETDNKFGITRRVNRAEEAQLFYNLANLSAEQAGFPEESATTIIIQNGTSYVPGWPLFETVWRETTEKFLFEKNLNEQKMLHEALQGAIGSLGDTHSEFYTPEQTRLQTGNLSGEIEGIGVYIQKD